MTRTEKAAIYFWSIRHLKPAMIYWRIHRTLKTALIHFLERRQLVRWLPKATRAAVPVRHFPALTSRYHCESIDLRTRHFSFLRDPVTLPSGRAERIATVARQPLLWQFHYGYHDYLTALPDRDIPVGIEEVLSFAKEWSEDHPAEAPHARQSAWHPYVLSIRIESWIRIHTRWIRESNGAQDRDEKIIRGVELMTRVLLRNIEYGTRANHLLRNIKALILAGVFLDHPTGKKALRKGLRMLPGELREQFLLDGMHYERSPMYHVSMLNDLLDIFEALKASGSEIPTLLPEVIGRATAFLADSLHPDGEIAYFNDSTGSFFLHTSEVLARARRICAEHGIPTVSVELAEDKYEQPKRISGLLVYRSKEIFVVFDAGEVGPRYQPGHAHCDTLSYEASWRGQRLVTDTGVFHYRESPERVYSRSTAGHNTVRIDGKDQSEVWKSFRVGRRAGIRTLSRRLEGGCTIFQAAHDGYARFENGLLHERVMVIRPDAWIAVVDFVHGNASHLVENVVHLTPEAKVSRKKEGSFVVTVEAGTCVVRPFREENMRMYETEYYPAFGEKKQRKTVMFHGTVQLPYLTGYIISFLPESEKIPVAHDARSVIIDSIRVTSQLDFGMR